MLSNSHNSQAITEERAAEWALARAQVAREASARAGRLANKFNDLIS